MPYPAVHSALSPALRRGARSNVWQGDSSLLSRCLHLRSCVTRCCIFVLRPRTSAVFPPPFSELNSASAPPPPSRCFHPLSFNFSSFCCPAFSSPSSHLFTKPSSTSSLSSSSSCPRSPSSSSSLYYPSPFTSSPPFLSFFFSRPSHSPSFCSCRSLSTLSVASPPASRVFSSTSSFSSLPFLAPLRRPSFFSTPLLCSDGNVMAWRAAARTKAASRAACTPYARPASACAAFTTLAASSSSAGLPAKRKYGEGHGSRAPLPLSSGISLHKKFGQHLLKNPAVLDKITRAADLRSSDTVLEIGPGTGNLTMRLLPLVREVVALDVDARMVNEVKKRATGNGFMNLKVRQGDALRADLGVFDVCAANLPYQISSHFLLRLLAHRPAFRCAVLMFQKEFGERLMAQPGDKNYCRLAVNVSLFCTVQRVCKVEAKHFTPPPKVDSVVVKIVPRPKRFQLDFKEWDGLMRICFGRKNRTLQALFRRSSVLSMLESNYKTWCSLNGVTPTSTPFREYCLGVLAETNLRERRSISIDIDTYFSLLLAFNKKGIHFVNVASVPDAAANAGGDPATGSAVQEAGIDEYFFFDEEADGKKVMEEEDDDEL